MEQFRPVPGRERRGNTGYLALAPLAAHVDALYLQCYAVNPNITPMEWAQMAQLQIKAAKLLNKTQTRLMLRSTYADESGPVPGPFWSQMLQFSRSMAANNMIDGIVIWDNPQRPFVAGLQ